MSRLHHTKTGAQSHTNQVVNGHPAFKLGEAIATKLTDYERTVADLLNRSQHRMGFRIRNGLLVLTALGFLLYFIALLT